MKFIYVILRFSPFLSVFVSAANCTHDAFRRESFLCLLNFFPSRFRSHSCSSTKVSEYFPISVPKKTPFPRFYTQETACLRLFHAFPVIKKQIRFPRPCFRVSSQGETGTWLPLLRVIQIVFYCLALFFLRRTRL